MMMHDARRDYDSLKQHPESAHSSKSNLTNAQQLAYEPTYPQLVSVPDSLGTLTMREREVLRLLEIGLSNREIADELVVSVGTVKWYIRQIYAKFDVHNRLQAIERAQQLRLT